uniref:Uncharacterized protein n=1 Tax=Spongospora subterranea TaxID=70186 RepID=A0A0H5RDP6_9EUKA|eukprot:CRZ11881.1 hypothetical protein [Spongospora subterranea]
MCRRNDHVVFHRFIAAITSLCGVLVLAIPITIISANFNSELNKMVRQKDVDFVRLLALKEDVERAYWDRARVEAKLLKGMESAWCDQDGRYFTEANVAPDKRALFKELGAANRSIQGARYRFTQFTEEQIQSIVTKNLTDLMKQISDTIQRQKSVSANQIKSILEVIPKFRSEPNPWCATPPEWMATATRRNTQTRTTDYPVHKNSNK